MLNAEFINAYSVYPIEQVLSSRLSTFVKTTFLSPVAPFAIYFYSANLLITPLTFLLNFLYDFLLNFLLIFFDIFLLENLLFLKRILRTIKQTTIFFNLNPFHENRLLRRLALNLI